MMAGSRYRSVLAVPQTNKGYDYRTGGLLPKFLSPRLYMNPLIAGFLGLLDLQFVELSDSVKRIQFYYNYTIDKNDVTLNL